MEVDRPPTVPSNAPPYQGDVRVCSEPGCGALIEYYSSVSSRCDRCTIRRKAREAHAMRGREIWASNGGVANASGRWPNGVGSDAIGMPGNGNPYPQSSVEMQHQRRRHSMHRETPTFPASTHPRPTPTAQMARPNPQLAHSSRTFMPIPHQRPPQPIPSSVASVPYINYFNSRGEMVQHPTSVPWPQPAPMVPPLHTSVSVRLCGTAGCNAILPPQYPGQHCRHCRASASQRQFAQPSSVPTTVQLQRPPLGLPIDRNGPPPKPLAPVEGDPVIDLTNLDAGLDDDDVEMDDLELTYPELPEQSPKSPFTTTPLPRAIPQKPTTNHHPPTPQRKRRKLASSHGHPSQSKVKLPARKTSMKLCSSTGCTGVVPPDSTSNRCLECVTRSWKRRWIGLGSGLADVDEGEDEELKKIVVTKEKKRRKGVTWADEEEGGCLEKTRETGQGEMEFVAEHKVMCRGAGDRRNCWAGKVDEDVVMENVGKKLMRSKAVDEDASESHLTFDEPPLSSSPSPEVPDMPSLPATPSPIEATQFIGGDHDLDLPTNAHISGWDSDLSDLSDSLDEGESSEDESSDSDSDSSTPPTPSTPTGLKIRIPARTKGPTPICASDQCSQVLVSGYRWKSCVMCRARNREYQRKLMGRHARLDRELKRLGSEVNGAASTSATTSRSASPGPGEKTKVKSCPSPVELEAALDYLQKSPEEPARLVPGAQLCSVRNCSHIIPPASEYRWKTCSRCRERARERNRRRSEKQRRLAGDMDASSSRTSHELPNDEEDVPLALAKARHEQGRCRSWDCGMFLDIGTKSAECKQCRARRLRASAKRGPPKTTSSSGIGDVLGRIGPKVCPPDKPRLPSPYIEYRCLSALLEDFRARLGGFLKAQSYYFMCNSNGLDCPPPALFGFDGEFSVVALDLDVPSRKADVEREVLKLKNEVEHVGRFMFSPKRMVSIYDFGIITRFVCACDIAILKPVVIQPGQEPTPAYSKKMQGELEISVLADQSHRFLSGQRTILRFRLIG